MKHTDERVALQAVEFWSTVSEEEVELAIEAQEVNLLNYYTRRGLSLLDAGTRLW